MRYLLGTDGEGPPGGDAGVRAHGGCLPEQGSEGGAGDGEGGHLYVLEFGDRYVLNAFACAE